MDKERLIHDIAMGICRSPRAHAFEGGLTVAAGGRNPSSYACDTQTYMTPLYREEAVGRFATDGAVGELRRWPRLFRTTVRSTVLEMVVVLAAEAKVGLIGRWIRRADGPPVTRLRKWLTPEPQDGRWPRLHRGR